MNGTTIPWGTEEEARAFAELKALTDLARTLPTNRLEALDVERAKHDLNEVWKDARKEHAIHGNEGKAFTTALRRMRTRLANDWNERLIRALCREFPLVVRENLWGLSPAELKEWQEADVFCERVMKLANAGANEYVEG